MSEKLKIKNSIRGTVCSYKALIGANKRTDHARFKTVQISLIASVEKSYSNFHYGLNQVWHN